MKLQILKKSDTKLAFVLEGADSAFANALRRVMMNEMPTMAIETVELEENTSGLFDEALAQRLGLIPLAFDRKLYSLKSECKCGGKGCSRCEVSFALDATGPYIVKAGDLVSDGEVKATDPDIPVVELLENQRLKLVAVAQLGLGKDHAKWQASVVGYQNTPIVKVGEGVTDKVVNVCPTHVFEKKDGRVRVAREGDCILCMRCVEVSEGVTVSASEDSFLFKAESVSGLGIVDIISSALDKLEEKAETFKSSLKEALK